MNFENIINMLYDNEDRGKDANSPARGWNAGYIFDPISKEDLLAIPPQSSRTAFNNENIRMSNYGSLSEED